MSTVISMEVWWLIVIIVCTGFGAFICGYGIGAYLQDIRSHENASDEDYSDHETEEDKDDEDEKFFVPDKDDYLFYNHPDTKNKEDEGGKKE